MLDEYFMDYRNNSSLIINKYIMMMEAEIEKKVDVELPYINGEIEERVFEFLKTKEMRESNTDIEYVISEMAEYFSGATRWHHPYVMNNIKTPVNLVSLAVAFNAMMLDPNLAGDTNCGQISYAEMEVIKYISELIGWDWQKSGGYFTFGGTSTLLNAVKFGLDKSLNNVVAEGVHEDVFIVSSEQGHSAHADVCNWLGIGRNSCVRVPVENNYQMDIKKTEEIISSKIEEGKKWIGIIACGGTTIQTIVDPIEEIFRMRERIIEKYNLLYQPHIHVDSVVGWVWLFYKKYSFEDNKLDISKSVSDKIRIMRDLIAQVKFADSIGIDFHKTGFCPYASSLILTKDRADVYKLNNKKEVDLNDLHYGEYSPSSYTLELSRSSIGPLTALTALKLFGYEGYQILLKNIIEGTYSLMSYIDQYDSFEVINLGTNGTCILFVVKPSELYFDYIDMPTMTEKDVISIALYNYNFYLFVLSKIKQKEINFFIDYSSGFEKVRNGFHMGVLKMQTFNPMLTSELAEKLANKIACLKKEFELINRNTNYDTIYKPKNFKLKYENNVYVFNEGEVCLKK